MHLSVSVYRVGNRRWKSPEQPPRKRLTEDRLPQAVGADEVGFDGSLEFVDDRQAALDFGYNLRLFIIGWERNRDNPSVPNIKMCLGR